MTPTAWRDLGRNRRFRWGVLIAAALVCVFLGAAQRELHAIDVYYADITLHILRSGEWMTLHAFDEGGSGIGAYVNKPPLQFWLSALLMQIFGVSTLMMTLVPRLLGVVCVLLTAAIGQRLYGRAVGWLAGVILLTTGPFIGPATEVLMDQGLVAGILLAIYGGLLRGWRGPVVVALGLALGTWIKGPQTFLALIPLLGYAAAGGYCCWPWATNARRWWLLIPLIPLTLAWQITLPWRLGDEVTKRWVADATTDPNHVVWAWGPFLGQMWKEYLNPFLFHLPWMPFVVDGAVRMIVRFRTMNPQRRAAAGMLLTWLISVSIAALALRMQTRYIMPLLPAAAIVSAWSIMRFARWRLPTWAPISLGALTAAVLIAVTFFPVRVAPITLPTIAAMRAYVDEAMPNNTALPILRPTTDADWWDIAWCRFYLRREGDGAAIPEPGQLALVSRYNIKQLPPDIVVDEIMRSRYIVLVRRRVTEATASPD